MGADLNQELDEARAKTATKQKELSKMEQEWADMDAIYATQEEILQKEITKVEKDFENLQNELKVMEKKVNDLKVQLETVKENGSSKEVNKENREKLENQIILQI